MKPKIIYGHDCKVEYKGTELGYTKGDIKITWSLKKRIAMKIYYFRRHIKILFNYCYFKIKQLGNK